MDTFFKSVSIFIIWYFRRLFTLLLARSVVNQILRRKCVQMLWNIHTKSFILLADSDTIGYTKTHVFLLISRNSAVHMMKVEYLTLVSMSSSRDYFVCVCMWRREARINWGQWLFINQKMSELSIKYTFSIFEISLSSSNIVQFNIQLVSFRLNNKVLLVSESWANVKMQSKASMCSKML